MKTGRAAWLLAPFFLLFALFWAVPLVEGARLSFQSNALYGETEWAGWAQYRAVWSDPRYAKALRNTLLYTASSLLLILPLSLALAHLIRISWPRARPLFLFFLLLPGLTPPAVLALLFLLVFHGREGVLNQWFVLPFGFAPINWLRDPNFILPALVLQCVWRWAGFVTFFILAGIEAIPRTLLEAAHLETNSRWQVFRHVTVPMLRHVLLFSGAYLVVDAFSLFSGAYVLLGGSGGTADAGLLLVSYAYQTAFGQGKFAMAAAMSLSLAPFLLITLWYCFIRPGRKRREQLA